MTAGVIVTVDSQRVDAMLQRVDTAISPVGLMGFLTGVIGPYIRERASDRFASEGDDVSGKWAPLQPATQEIRSRGEWPVSATHPINVRTHELERFITQSNAAVWGHTLGASLRYPDKQPTRRSITQKMETAQRGRANPRTVARPVLGLNERDLAFTMQSLMFHIQTAGRGQQ